jgi:hypothetical protein
MHTSMPAARLLTACDSSRLRSGMLQPPGGCWSAGGDSGSDVEGSVNPFDLAEPTTSEEEGAAGAGDTTDDAGGTSATVKLLFQRYQPVLHSICLRLILKILFGRLEVTNIMLLCITGSSSGDEAMGDDFASADLWAARIEAAERGNSHRCILDMLRQS